MTVLDQPQGTTLRPEPSPPGSAGRPVRRPRRPLVIAATVCLALLALVIVLTLLAAGSSRGGDLDPRSAAPTGTLALANLLRNRGLTVDRGAAVRPGGTLVVPFADRLDDAELARVLDDARLAGRIVLLTPTGIPGSAVSEDGIQSQSARSPGCDLAAAVLAGRAEVGDRTFRGGSPSCYGGSLVLVDRPGARVATPVLALGSAGFLTNDKLDQQGNAALALALLSGTGVPGAPSDQVVWYQPALDPQAGSTGLLDLVPRALPWVVLQLALALVVVALWRARRLGPVVEEPLPVVVPAAETVQGRARLYAAGHARAAAAEALRAGARARLGGVLAHGTEPD